VADDQQNRSSLQVNAHLILIVKGPTEGTDIHIDATDFGHLELLGGWSMVAYDHISS
jgi:hypothetical protein